MNTKDSNATLGLEAPDLIGDVLAFHKKFNIELPTAPVMNKEAALFRLKFLREELKELEDAIEAGDLVEVADAFTDITYVAIGGALQMGLPFGLLWGEVQRSNMDKVPAGPEQSWKHCVKPPDWIAPKIVDVLALAGWEVAK